MAATSNLTNLFGELNRYGQNGEHDRAVKVANKILHEAPDDDKAFHCKVVCLIQLGRFDEALTAINKNPKLAEELHFEKAYCEYRLNRTRDALKTLNAVDNPDDRLKELRGQVLYRLEEYEECLDVYRDLVKNTQDDYEEERETNLSAVLAALQTQSSEPIDDMGLQEHTYELCYNKACYLTGRQEYEAAAQKLATAERLCRQSFEDDPDVTEDEIGAELGVIRVQQGYIHQQLDHNDEAGKLYNQVLKQKPSDIALAAVASNNIVTLNKEANVFDSKKKMRTATADGLHHKLTSEQRESISMNQCLLYMYMNQGEQCCKMARTLQQSYPDSDSPSLIEAAQYCKEKQTPKAIETLEKQINDSEGNSVTLRLSLAQLYLSQGSVYPACDTLRSLGDLSYKPGVVSTLVTLYLSQEDREAAEEVLSEAISWYQQHEPRAEELLSLMKANCNFLLRHGNPRQATEMLEQLRKRDSSDYKTLAQLIFAYSKFDQKKAQEVSRELPSPEEMAQDVDVEALEIAACTFVPKYLKKAAKVEQSPKPKSPPGDEKLIQKKKRKHKKGKLPKNLDPDAAIDAERWLPRRERSYFKGKRRDKRKDVGKGTQGSAPTGLDMDASKSPTAGASAANSDVGSPRPGSTPSGGSQQAQGGATAAPSGAAAQPTSGPRQQKPASGGGARSKRKKKGGNKW